MGIFKAQISVHHNRHIQIQTRQPLLIFPTLQRNTTFWGCASRRGLGGYDSQIRTWPSFLCNAPTRQVSSSYVYSFRSYHVDKQTDTAESINALCYAMTLGDQWFTCGCYVVCVCRRAWYGQSYWETSSLQRNPGSSRCQGLHDTGRWFR